MINGVTVKLLEKTRTGTDDFGAPIYEEIPVDIENVLVGEPSAEDVTQVLSLYGKHVQYILAIPKGDTHVWEDKKVILPEPFAGTYRTIGFSTAGIEANIPLSWNRKVKVERFE